MLEARQSMDNIRENVQDATDERFPGFGPGPGLENGRSA